MADTILTRQRVKELFNYNPETGVFTWKVGRSNVVKVGDIAGSKNHVKQYVSIKIDHMHYMAHRLAWLYSFGVLPKHQIDHIDGNRKNNKLSNLREATNSENQQNLRRPSTANTSGYIGVSFSKAAKKWKATICLNKKIIHLGVYETPEIAREVYLKAKKLMHTHAPI